MVHDVDELLAAYVPGTHFVHDDDPVEEEYFPVGQAVQLIVSDEEKVPAWQRDKQEKLLNVAPVAVLCT